MDSPHHPPARLTWIAGTLCAALFGLAFVIAPRSCDGGLEVYVWSGAAAIIVLLVMPLVADSGKSVLKRITFSLAWGVIGALAWLTGIFAGPVRVLCRLF